VVRPVVVGDLSDLELCMGIVGAEVRMPLGVRCPEVSGQGPNRIPV
jgi:hypothetical protein